MVWEDWRNDIGDINAQIPGERRQPAGRELPGERTAGLAAYWSAIGGDAHGNFVIAWGSGIQGWDIWAQRYDSAGLPRAQTSRPTTTRIHSATSGRRRSGVDPGGSFLVAWDDWRGDTLNSQVFAQRYDAAGQAQGANFRVNDSIPGRAAYSSSIAYDGSGNCLVVWADNRTGQARIYGRSFDPAGSRLGGNFPD